MEGVVPETQMRGGVGIHRSSSSEPLLESAPSSHCTPADADGGEAMETAMAAAYQREVEETAVGVKEEEVVVVVVESQLERAPTAASKGFDVQGAAAREGGGMSSGEAVEQGQEREKGKTKKRWSWLPDPEKRWPVQGW